MRFPAVALAACVALGVAFAAHPASATTMRHLDTRELTLGSSEIVIGEVEAVRPHWDSAHRKIFTDVDINITSSLKGADTPRITLTQLGGELDGVRYSVPGGPLFKPGSQALLFVWRDRRGTPQVNGLAQGKFDVERDAKTGTLMVQRNTPGFAVKDVKSLATVTSATAATRLPLDDLVREIKSALGTGAGR